MREDTAPAPRQPKPPGLAFELRYPDGNWVRLHFNGNVEGAPPNTVVINHAANYLYYLQAYQEMEDAARGTEKPDRKLADQEPNGRQQEKNNSDMAHLCVDVSHKAPHLLARQPPKK